MRLPQLRKIYEMDEKELSLLMCSKRIQKLQSGLLLYNKEEQYEISDILLAHKKVFAALIERQISYEREALVAYEKLKLGILEQIKNEEQRSICGLMITDEFENSSQRFAM